MPLLYNGEVVQARGSTVAPMRRHSGAMRRIEPGIQGFPDVQLHI
jgi:hypothetical protein